jgi:hypothetical protein
MIPPWASSLQADGVVEGEGRGSHEEQGGYNPSLGPLLKRQRAEWRTRGVAPMRRKEKMIPLLGPLLYRQRAEWRARGVAPMRREEPSISMTAPESRFSAT